MAESYCHTPVREKLGVSSSIAKKEIANKIKKEVVNATTTQAVKEPIKNKRQ
jgi:hypothetical protein